MIRLTLFLYTLPKEYSKGLCRYNSKINRYPGLFEHENKRLYKFCLFVIFSVFTLWIGCSGRVWMVLMSFPPGFRRWFHFKYYYDFKGILVGKTMVKLEKMPCFYATRAQNCFSCLIFFSWIQNNNITY